MNLRVIKAICFLVFFQMVAAPVVAQTTTPYDMPPPWARYAVWYQVFVERFNNGDPLNDPKPANINIGPIGEIAPAGWAVTPWEHDWYAQEPWANEAGFDFYRGVQMRRYGGDLKGLLDKLDYLKDLGITAIYLNPINDAPTLHKYDARHYHHVDVNFGPDPEGDNRIIASEIPDDPSTWKWTSADKLFLELVSALHRRNIRVIMDYSWNHTGVLFWAWQDILKNGPSSRFNEWYEISAFDDPATPANEFAYAGWAGVENLPEIKKVGVVPPRISGKPYEGDIHPGMKKHIFDVTRRWLAPDGDTSKGIDGFRLDVADQVGLIFWRDYRRFVRSVKSDAYLVGEIWWEKWPGKLMDPAPYTRGDMFDAVMFYQVYKPARYFFAKTSEPCDAATFRDSLIVEWNRPGRENLYAMMNVSSSHDAPRLLTDFANPNRYKYHMIPREDSTLYTAIPGPETYKRLRLYLIHLFTTIGAPQIWNGEEMGMTGADDPDCRKPLWWPGIEFSTEGCHPATKNCPPVNHPAFNQEQFNLYRQLIRIRTSNPVLSDGEFEFLEANGHLLAYKRYNKKEEIIVIFNAGDTGRTFTVPEGEYTDLLSGKHVRPGQYTVPALEAVVLKRK